MLAASASVSETFDVTHEVEQSNKSGIILLFKELYYSFVQQLRVLFLHLNSTRYLNKRIIQPLLLCITLCVTFIHIQSWWVPQVLLPALIICSPYWLHRHPCVRRAPSHPKETQSNIRVVLVFSRSSWRRYHYYCTSIITCSYYYPTILVASASVRGTSSVTYEV